MEGCESDEESGANYLVNDLKGYSYEEQFKQLYDLSDHPDRRSFLNDLFAFMQQRGTPVNRIPIMAKQVLDLYELYRLVVARGGLVEVINKKIWREITKGLNLPSSITSAAFTLRTQYMKYLYPYECEKEHLSSPDELQQAIDGNRREGRRSSYGHYSDMIGSPVGAGGSGGSGGGSNEGLAGPSVGMSVSGLSGLSVGPSGYNGGPSSGAGPSASSSHRSVSTPSLHHLSSSSALSLVNRHLINGISGQSVNSNNNNNNGHGNRSTSLGMGTSSRSVGGSGGGGGGGSGDCGSGSSGDEDDNVSSIHPLSIQPLLALASAQAQAQAQAQAEALNLETKPSINNNNNSSAHSGLNGPSSSSHRNVKNSSSSSPLSLVNRHLMNGVNLNNLNNNNHNGRQGSGQQHSRMNTNQSESIPMDDCGSGSSGEDEEDNSINSLSFGQLLGFASAQAQAEAINLEAKNGNGLSVLHNHINNLASNNQNLETNNNNNSMLLSMKVNNIIYSGILYATRPVKR
ncbi:uncharacterized protein DDB_G0283357-like [Panonychus citri]|uniref:uncharacterized protein DDB_G0283357-like n=1 Tax=Panonychus citri TaxID=50023 RepID=UPI00230791A3|nr:uncharacterized protein DDB_G0283357-like [Panonychus citri]